VIDPQKLAARRRALVERSTALRAALVANATPLAQRASMLDGVALAVRRYWVVTAVAAGAVALFGSRRLFDMASRVLTLYALFRR
jgi:hypothetical protein